MNEIVKFWFENLVNREIEDTLDDIKNTKMWCLGSGSKEELQMQMDNLSLLNEYLTALKKLKNRVEREEL